MLGKDPHVPCNLGPIGVQGACDRRSASECPPLGPMLVGGWAPTCLPPFSLSTQQTSFTLNLTRNLMNPLWLVPPMHAHTQTLTPDFMEERVDTVAS